VRARVRACACVCVRVTLCCVCLGVFVRVVGRGEIIQGCPTNVRCLFWRIDRRCVILEPERIHALTIRGGLLLDDIDTTLGRGVPGMIGHNDGVGGCPEFVQRAERHRSLESDTHGTATVHLRPVQCVRPTSGARVPRKGCLRVPGYRLHFSTVHVCVIFRARC
jgi:hypothetical protein